VSRKLVVSDGMRERELQLVGRLVIGRDPACDISHDHSLLSRRHAEFITVGDEVTVRDLGSRNGVFVNGARAAECALMPGDVVQIGPLRARYVFDAAPLSISPEEMDTERTVVIPPLPVLATGTAEGLPRVKAGPPTDEEVTRLVRGPRLAAPVPRPTRVSASDHDRTGYIAAPAQAARIADAERAAGSAASEAVPVGSRSAAPHASLTTFVFVQLLMLAGIVLAAAALPSLVWRRALLTATPADGASTSIVWLTIPIGVAVLATYLVSAAINRRFSNALAVERHRTQGR
jgi:predicted component of type VI protein secretion system